MTSTRVLKCSSLKKCIRIRYTKYLGKEQEQKCESPLKSLVRRLDPASITFNALKRHGAQCSTQNAALLQLCRNYKQHFDDVTSIAPRAFRVEYNVTNRKASRL